MRAKARPIDTDSSVFWVTRIAASAAASVGARPNEACDHKESVNMESENQPEPEPEPERIACAVRTNAATIGEELGVGLLNQLDF